MKLVSLTQGDFGQAAAPYDTWKATDETRGGDMTSL